MAEIGSAFVSVIPSARGFGTKLNSQVSPQLSRSGAAMGAGLGKSMLKGFIAIGAGIQIAQFLGDSLAEAREANAVAALTANVIKTTGGAAKVSAVQVNRLADALSRKTGIDDEQIASAANLLLTFKNVKREGEGLENIFNRATRASVDLAASGFGDTASTAKMLGKALNDPLKGITALGRAGVTFTEAQKDQIKTLVESGQSFKAQKLILAEVESQVKGAAEAQVTNSDKARVALGNLKETIGQSLIPAVDALSGLFVTKIAPALTTFVTNLQSGNGSAGRFASVIRDQVLPVVIAYYTYIFTKVIPAIRDGLVPWLERGKTAFAEIRKVIADNKPQLQQLLTAFKQIANFILTKSIPALIKVASFAIPILVAAFKNAVAVATFVVDAFNTVRSALQKISGAVATAIGAFTKFAVAVRQKVSNVIATVKTLPGKIQGVFAGAINILAGAGRALIQGLINGISEKIGEAVQKVRDGLTKIKNMLPGSPIKEGPLKPWNGGRPGKLLMEMLAKGIDEGSKTAADAMGNALEKVGKKAKEKIKGIRDHLATVKSDFASLVEPIASNFTQGLFDFDTAGAFTANLSTVKGTLTTLIANFKKLIGEGLAPGFLYRLFQEGGPALINSLASLDKASALSAGGLFGDVMSLSDQLGTAVAGSTDKGAALENQTTRLEKKLDKLTKSVDHQADRIGQVINGAASSGRRRAA